MKQIYSVTKAYHSTRQKGLKKFESRTTTATIDTGEGAHVHGWGLYLQADEMENREMYLDMFTGNSTNRHNNYLVTAWGDQYEAICSDDICDIDDFNSFDVYDFSSVNGNSHLTTPGQLYLNLKVYGYSNLDISTMLTEVIDEISSLEDDDDQFPEILIHWSEDDLKEVVRMAGYGIPDFELELLPGEDPDPLPDGTHYEQASQYTVEIPDDMVFIDEYQVVPEWIFTKSIESNILPDKEKEDWNDVGGFSGYDFYNLLKRNLKSDEKASLWLSENGIDGMTYEGGRDHGCFVIYNCDKLKIIAEY